MHVQNARTYTRARARTKACICSQFHTRTHARTHVRTHVRTCAACMHLWVRCTCACGSACMHLRRQLRRRPLTTCGSSLLTIQPAQTHLHIHAFKHVQSSPTACIWCGAEVRATLHACTSLYLHCGDIRCHYHLQPHTPCFGSAVLSQPRFVQCISCQKWAACLAALFCASQETPGSGGPSPPPPPPPPPLLV